MPNLWGHKVFGTGSVERIHTMAIEANTDLRGDVGEEERLVHSGLQHKNVFKEVVKTH
jgi:hypothetical protein